MLEGQPPITDPRIARLLQRLQSARERWHQRGYEDGIQWAVELATRDELQNIATHLAEQDGQQLALFFHKLTATAHPVPSSVAVFHMQPPKLPAQPVAGGIFHTSLSSGQAVPDMPPGSPHVLSHHIGGIPFHSIPSSFHPDERLQYWQEQDREMSAEASQGEAVRIEVDESAYLEGWRDAVKGIWQTIAPALS